MADDATQELDAMKAALESLQPLNEAARARAMEWLAGALTVSLGESMAAGPQQLRDAPPGDGGSTGMTPRQFITAKKPKTDVERVACLAYYLTRERDTATFKTADVTALNTEAAAPKFSNPSSAVRNALNQNQYLAQAGNRDYQTTPRGEALVDALPDRQAVDKALEAHPFRKRRASRKTATKR